MFAPTRFPFPIVLSQPGQLVSHANNFFFKELQRKHPSGQNVHQSPFSEAIFIPIESTRTPWVYSTPAVSPGFYDPLETYLTGNQEEAFGKARDSVKT
jgi:hypothetical protein